MDSTLAGQENLNPEWNGTGRKLKALAHCQLLLKDGIGDRVDKINL